MSDEKFGISYSPVPSWKAICTRTMQRLRSFKWRQWMLLCVLLLVGRCMMVGYEKQDSISFEDKWRTWIANFSNGTIPAYEDICRITTADFGNNSLKWPNAPFILKPPDPATYPMGKRCSEQRRNNKLKRIIIPFIYGEINGAMTVFDITLYTQLSPNRLHSLLRISRVWKGPICVAVGGNETEIGILKSWLKNAPEDFRRRDNIRIHGVMHLGDIYPVNILRNVALYYVKSTYAFACDVDFVPMTGSYDRLLNHMIKEDDTSGRRVFIVPALESFPDRYEVPNNKTGLFKDYQDKKVDQFHKGYAPLHRRTMFEKWWKTDEAYTTQYEESFEPYTVARKASLPCYHSALIGRDLDKISQIWAVSLHGFEFVVLPNIFIVHLNHPRSKVTDITAAMCARETFNKYKSLMQEVHGHNN